MKKIITKIFLSTFVVGFFSLGLSFVFGIDYPNYATSNECGQIPIRSSYSTNGTTYVTNNTYILNWYVNKPAAIGWATAGLGNAPSVCVGSTPIEGGATRVSWKKDLCSSNYSKLEQYQKDLFTKYASKVNYQDPWGFDSKENVWGLQNLMKKVNCQNHRDCKLGVVTISDFLFCNVCDDLGTEWTELDSLEPKECPPNYIFAGTGDICCQPGPTVCLKPTITVNGEINKTTYNDEEGDLEVIVDYSDNEIGNITFPDLNKVVIIPANALNSEKIANTEEKTITFSLSTNGTDSISINVENGCAVLETKPCPPVEIKLNRKIDCQLTKDWQQCDNRASFNITNESSFTGFASLLAEGVLCKKGTLEIPFCPDQCTNRKFDTQICEQTYGSGWFSDGKIPACCDVCGVNQKVTSTGTGCECSKTQSDCEKNGDKLNEKTCKCECDSTKRCCGILLNTVVPFIGDCIEMTSQNDVGSSNDANTSTVNQLNAFPFLMMGLSKIMVTLILVFSFLIVIAAGLMMVTGVYDEGNYKTGMDRIKKVVFALILLGSSGLILRLINPSFFGG